jgi:phosphopantothenoylcysteine decarboxylase/phosphopantothenate--cysteine ligase
LPLSRTKDILAAMGSTKPEGQLLIGFALETENGVANAQSKLERKNLDFIVLNSLQHTGAGFAHDTNRISIIGKDNRRSDFELKSKGEVAIDIIRTITAWKE